MIITIPNLIEETIFGKSTKPILRTIAWEDSYIQWKNLVYKQIRFNKLDNITINVENQVIVGGKATLHFRRKDDI